MGADVHQFRISPKEKKYLERLFAANQLFETFPRPQKDLHGEATIQLSRAQIEDLTEYLTVRLAEGGFDENYEPNEEGRTLEDLIDRFLVR